MWVGERRTGSIENGRPTSSFHNVSEQRGARADPAVMGSDLYRHSLVRVQLPAGEIYSMLRCHASLEHDMTRLQIGHQNEATINRRKRLAYRNIDGKSPAVVQRENVSTQVCHPDAALIVEIERGEKGALLRFYLKDEVLFPMNCDDAVGAAKNIRSDTKFESWFGDDAGCCRMTKWLGPAKRRRVIHLTTSNLDVLRT